LWRTELSALAFVHNHDFVTFNDCLETMSDDKHGAVFE